MAWAMLPGLMLPMRINASGGWNRGWSGWLVFGGSLRDPCGRPGAPDRALCQCSPLTISSIARAGALVVESGTAADQGTADDGTRREDVGSPPVADGEPVHGGTENGGAAGMSQVAAGGRGGDGAHQGDPERRTELLGGLGERLRRTCVAQFDTLLPDRDCRNSDGFISSPSGSRRIRLAPEHGRMQRARQAHRQDQPTRQLSGVAAPALSAWSSSRAFAWMEGSGGLDGSRPA
jgi:hypothetical protein